MTTVTTTDDLLSARKYAPASVRSFPYMFVFVPSHVYVGNSSIIAVLWYSITARCQGMIMMSLNKYGTRRKHGILPPSGEMRIIDTIIRLRKYISLIVLVQWNTKQFERYSLGR